MIWRPVFESLGFQVVWLASVVGAAGGSSLPGLLAAGAFVAAQMATSHQSSPNAAIILASGAVGGIVESTLATAGVLEYAAPWPGPPLAPIWVVALWLAFGSLLATIARLLEPHAPPKSAVLGALLAPLSYAAGDRLGAIQMADPKWTAYLAIAVAWAIALPALTALAQRRSSVQG